MGGMSAFIPVNNDPALNDRAFEQVRLDKLREAKEKHHDGTWVAHPKLVSVAREIFDAYMPDANQISYLSPDPLPEAEDLLAVPEGTITEAGVRTNIGVGLRYLTAWLGGSGAVPINNLMEDAATAEICRSQIWQWLRYGAKLDDTRIFEQGLFERIFTEEQHRAHEEYEDREDRYRLEQAGDLFRYLVLSEEFPEFLTTAAYELLP